MVTITTGGTSQVVQGINPTGTMHTLSGCSVYYFGTEYTIQLPNKEEGTCFKIKGKVSQDGNAGNNNSIKCAAKQALAVLTVAEKRVEDGI